MSKHIKIDIEITDETYDDIMYSARQLAKLYEELHGEMISEDNILRIASEVGILNHISSNIQLQLEIYNSKIRKLKGR